MMVLDVLCRSMQNLRLLLLPQMCWSEQGCSQRFFLLYFRHIFAYWSMPCSQLQPGLFPIVEVYSRNSWSTPLTVDILDWLWYISFLQATLGDEGKWANTRLWYINSLSSIKIIPPKISNKIKRGLCSLLLLYFLHGKLLLLTSLSTIPSIMPIVFVSSLLLTNILPLRKKKSMVNHWTDKYIVDKVPSSLKSFICSSYCQVFFFFFFIVFPSLEHFYLF